MLFTESKSLDYVVGVRARTSLLESLQGRGFVPLIRSARLHLYETALAGAEEQASALEGALAGRAEAELETPYVRGELFCLEDCAHFLLFGDEPGEGTRAGIVYENGMADPLEKLDAFCRLVRESLDASVGRAGPARLRKCRSDWNGRTARRAYPIAFDALRRM